jgi:hypothetical protein
MEVSSQAPHLSPLLKIPFELGEEIWEHLNDDEAFQALSLTCKSTRGDIA